jgi:hypothetical protein
MRPDGCAIRPARARAPAAGPINRVMITAPRVALLALLSLVVAPAAAGATAHRGAARPSITSIGPASVAVGDTLTIRGRGFLPGRRRDSVSFTRPGHPAVTVKATDATRTRIRVVVPVALERYLGDTQPSRVRVRVRARRFSAASAARNRSVLVRSRAAQEALDGAPGDCTSADPLDDVTGALGDTLGPDLGDAPDDVLPDDGGCDAASPDDPAAAGDGSGPAADDGVDVPDDSGADDPSSE